jgi:hypothetical protein
MNDTNRAVIAAMEALQLSDFSERPASWVMDRYYFNEGARAGARLLRRHLDSIERQEENARAKRLEAYFGKR